MSQLLSTSGKPRRPRRHRRGNAVMEAALVFPVLISLTFGSIEFGHFFFTKHTLAGAAREGARAAIIPGATNGEVTTAVGQSMTAAGFNSANYTVQIRNATDTGNVDVSTAAAGTAILVKVNATWGTVGIRPLSLISTTKQVVGQTVMRKEG